MSISAGKIRGKNEGAAEDKDNAAKVSNEGVYANPRRTESGSGVYQ